MLGAVAVAVATIPWAAQAVTYEGENVTVDFTSTISTGFGVRTRNPAADLVTDGNTGGVAGQTNGLGGIGDQGNLNYGRGDLFTAYAKGSHELLVKLPEQFTFMTRAAWVRDFAATHTTGNLSVASQGLPGVGSDGLTDDARKDLRFKARLLDLWVSKSFRLGDQQARVRVGNQVISWGESLFIPGGINQTNAVDVQRLLQPGTQLKEAVLPAPIVSFATGLGGGVNVEAYLQSRWNASYMPPVGGYWSNTQFIGNGTDVYGADVISPDKKTGQWGVSLRWQPQNLSASFGLYAMNYHEKGAQLSVANIPTTGRAQWLFATDRKMYGVSANLPVGDWAVGSELSFRPKDAVALNSNVSLCSSQNGHCWVDEKRYQWHVTGLYSLTPSNSRDFLSLIGADGGTFLSEFVMIRYPGLKSEYGGDPIAAGGWGWGNEFDPTATPRSVGTKTSTGIALDFSVVYDGSVLPGWQVVPEIYYQRALGGRTPTLAGTFMSGAQSANLIVNFLQNPLKWQFGLNYAKFWGGSQVFDQTYRDRDFVGGYVSFNF
jgi:hypothetical protein